MSNFCWTALFWDHFLLGQVSFFWVQQSLGQFTLDQISFGINYIGAIFFGSNFLNFVIPWVQLPWTEMFWVEFHRCNVHWVDLPWTQFFGQISLDIFTVHRNGRPVFRNTHGWFLFTGLRYHGWSIGPEIGKWLVKSSWSRHDPADVTRWNFGPMEGQALMLVKANGNYG